MTSKNPNSAKSSPTSTPSSNPSDPPQEPTKTSPSATDTNWTPHNYRGHNNYNTAKASDEAAIPAQLYGDSMTILSQQEDTDLNIIMERFGITGRMPETPRIPIYGDFSTVTDYRSALEVVRAADYAFMELPATVRARFENNPQLLLEFCADEKNKPEAERLGLIKPPVATPPTVPPAPNSAPASSGTAQAPPTVPKTPPST